MSTSSQTDSSLEGPFQYTLETHVQYRYLNRGKTVRMGTSNYQIKIYQGWRLNG